MEQVMPNVIPEDMWIVIRNMGRAIEALAASPSEQTLILVHWRWMDFVEVLEAWTGPNDVEGVERWSPQD